jgi:hypothetical protein
MGCDSSVRLNVLKCATNDYFRNTPHDTVVHQIGHRSVGNLNIIYHIIGVEFVLDLRVLVLPSRNRPGLVSFLTSQQNDLS